MNFRSLFLERPYDVRLCEAHDFMSAGIEASAAMTATGVTELMNLINNNRNNATNMSIANANNQTAVNIARENNALQRELLKLQQQYESAEAERARLWNSPVNQVRLMREAGINPATAIAGGSGSMGTSSAMAHAPSSGVSPSMPTLTTPRMEAFRLASPSAAMADIGAAIASLESANKTSKEAELAEKSMNDVLRRIKADADTSEVARDIELIYGSQKANMQVSVMKADLAVKTEQALNLAKEGKFIDAKTILTRTEERVTQMDYHLKKSQNAILQNDLSTYFTTLNARIDNMRSQTASNYALSRLNNERASQLTEMHSDIVQMQKWLTDIKGSEARIAFNDAELAFRTFDNHLNYLQSHYQNMSMTEVANCKRAQELLELARKENNMYYFHEAVNIVDKTLSHIENLKGVGGYKQTDERVQDKDGSFIHERTFEYKSPWSR